MAEKQSQLNGAYYGPSIPQQTQSYNRPGHGHGHSGCCCMLSMFFKILGTIIIILGLAALIFWLIFRPNTVKFHVTSATLTQFNFTTNNTLNYNLALNITVRNPNRKIGIYYDRIEATALYDDTRFSTVWLTPFYQGHKTTSMLSPVFDGQQRLVVLGTSDVAEFDSEKSAGVYDIDLKLYLRVRFKVGKIKVGKFKPEVKCGLKVPLSSSGNSVAGFQTTKCDVDF